MKYAALILAVLLSACGGSKSPTAPTPPPVIVLPPVTPPAPTITNYAGRWFGEYVVVQCAGSSGSMGDVLCSSPRPGNPGGLFQPNSRSGVALELFQLGSSVNGTLGFGGISGPVSGSITNQRLTLSGLIVYSDPPSGLSVTNVLSNWDTAIVGDQLVGDFTLNIKVNIFPGDGVVRLRLQNMRR